MLKGISKTVCLVIEKATGENGAYVQTGKLMMIVMRIVFIQTPGTNHKLRNIMMDITNHVDFVLGFHWRHNTQVCSTHMD